MKIAVVICTYNRPDALSDALASCLRQTRRAYEVIIVDDGQLSYELLDAFRQRFEQAGTIFTYHRKHSDQRGLTRSRNVAWRSTDADVLFYIDDDATLPPKCIEYVETVFAADVHGELAAVDFPIREAKQAFVGRRLIERLYDIAGLWSPLKYHQRRAALPAHLSALGYLHPVPFLQGGSLAARRSTLAAVGGFDENLPGHGLGEDKEISVRLARVGYVARIDAERVDHQTHPAGRENAFRSGYETVYNYLYINGKVGQLNVGTALLLAYTVCCLMMISGLYAVIGDRRFHCGQLGGMASALWSIFVSVLRNGRLKV